MISLLNSNTNIFNLDVEAIVNPVNCCGIMGAGLALAFKKNYPENYKAYRKECLSGNLIMGRVFGYRNSVSTNPKYIINLPTKKHWSDSSTLDNIEQGVLALRNFISNNNIKSVAIPAIGCGLGGLNWQDVKIVLYNKLADIENVDLYLIEKQQ